MHELNWGIMGTGSIARKFAAGLGSADGARLVAVGSRSAERAKGFAEEMGASRSHGSYEELAADAEVQAIYVATPHPAHAACSLAGIEAGKAVLCEKPFTVNASEASKLVAAARAKGVFLMEAMWTRFLPAVARLRGVVAGGDMGEPRMLMADFGFRSGWNPEGRLLSPALAGGGLLDVGVYPISLAHMLLGEPEEVTGLAEIGPTGVDEQAGVVLRHAEGRISVLACGVRTRTPQEATVLGTEGWARLAPPWWRSTTLTVSPNGKEPEATELPYEGNGYNCEAEEVARCLAEGRTESERMPLDESVAVMRTMDRLREGWGLRYPME